MSGSRLLLDTNAIVALLKGNQAVSRLLKSATWIGISIVSQLEFLCFVGLSDDDRQLFEQFHSRVHVIGITPDQPDLLERILDVRRRFRRKLPDSIVAATALHFNAGLVTEDLDFSKIEGLEICKF